MQELIMNHLNQARKGLKVPLLSEQSGLAGAALHWEFPPAA